MFGLYGTSWPSDELTKIGGVFHYLLLHLLTGSVRVGHSLVG